MKIGLAGATGLVGGLCADRLRQEPRIESVALYGRRSGAGSDPKFRAVLTDFASFAADGGGALDAGICALGTTLRKAGSQDAFFKVDHDFVLAFAKRCRELGARKFIAVSAMGADAGSRVFYNRVKGETERDLTALGFDSLVIVRPSLILGERAEARFLESLAIGLAPLVAPLLIGPLKAGRPVEAARVAAAAVSALFRETGPVEIVSNERLLEDA